MSDNQRIKLYFDYKIFDGEPFWGHDRIPLLEERLTERGLLR